MAFITHEANIKKRDDDTTQHQYKHTPTWQHLGISFFISYKVKKKKTTE